MRNTIGTFLKENERINYYNHLKKNNGTIEAIKESNLDLLLTYLFQAYLYCHVLHMYRLSSPIFFIMDAIMQEETIVEEKIIKLKQILFIESMENYNETILLVQFIYDENTGFEPYILSMLNRVLLEADFKAQYGTFLIKVKECLNYMAEEMNLVKLSRKC